MKEEQKKPSIDKIFSDDESVKNRYDEDPYGDQIDPYFFYGKKKKKEVNLNAPQDPVFVSKNSETEVQKEEKSTDADAPVTAPEEEIFNQKFRKIDVIDDPKDGDFPADDDTFQVDWEDFEQLLDSAQSETAVKIQPSSNKVTQITLENNEEIEVDFSDDKPLDNKEIDSKKEAVNHSAGAEQFNEIRPAAVYYDANGNCIEGGYYDKDGNYVVEGYYDEDGNYVEGGYYDKHGNFVVEGYYDENGNYVEGGYYDKDGNFFVEGYYDKDGNYVPGGYYDKNGNFIEDEVYDDDGTDADAGYEDDGGYEDEDEFDDEEDEYYDDEFEFVDDRDLKKEDRNADGWERVNQFRESHDEWFQDTNPQLNDDDWEYNEPDHYVYVDELKEKSEGKGRGKVIGLLIALLIVLVIVIGVLIYFFFLK